MTREQLIQKITAAKEELNTADKIHSHNLWKRIHHMEREPGDYDQFQSAVTAPFFRMAYLHNIFRGSRLRFILVI